MSSMGRIRKTKRVLIANYETALVPGLMKLLDEKHYCLFIVFSDASEIGTVQKAMGKKRIVPILMDDDKNKAVSEQLLKTLPAIDVVINVNNSSTVSKFYEKRKRYRPFELKLHKTTAADVARKVTDAGNEPCFINLIPESHTGVSHMFEADGIDIPISTHLTTTLRNSIRKIFPGRKTLSSPLKDSKENVAGSTSNGMSSGTPPARSLSLRLKLRSDKKSTENIPSEGSADKVKVRRTLSLLSKNKRPSSALEVNDPIDQARNRIWQKENKSFKKSMNKLHADYAHRLSKSLKKLNSAKLKKQQRAEKEIEVDMAKEKSGMDSKLTEMNATTLSRSSALTPDTANRIVASREARVNKEVCRNANRKKVVEFKKIEEAHNEKLSEVHAKHHEAVVKAQLECLEKTTKKYQEKLSHSDRKFLQRSDTVA